MTEWESMRSRLSRRFEGRAKFWKRKAERARRTADALEYVTRAEEAMKCAEIAASLAVTQDTPSEPREKVKR